MPDTWNLPPAMDLPDALTALLGALHTPISAAEAREALGRHPTADGILAELERRRHLARWARIDSGDFRYVRLPALMETEEERYLLLLERKGPSLLCEGLGRTRARVPWRLLANAARSVLDMTPALPPGGLWRGLLALLISQRRPVVSILWTVLIMQALGLLTPQFARLLVDRAFPDGARSLFAVLILGSCLQAAFQSGLGWVQTRLIIHLETRLRFQIQQGLLSHLLRLPFPFLSRKTIGELMQGFHGIHAAKELLTGSVLGTIVNNLASLGYVVMMARLLPAATAVLVLLTLLNVTITVLFSLHLTRLQAIGVEAEARERSMLVELLNGLSLIKATGSEGRTAARWSALYLHLRGIQLHIQRLNLAGMGGLGVFQGLCTQVFTLWGGLMVLKGELQLGAFLAFTMMAGAFEAAISGTGNVFVQWRMLRPLLEKGKQILETRAVAPPPLRDSVSLRGSLHIHDLWFRYDQERSWIFQGLHLDVHPGEKILLRGPSGCGKSTLLKLLAGLHAPGRGTITVAGASPANARQAIAYLPQFIQLFQGSILENLRLLSGAEDRTKLMEAAEQSGLHHLVRSLPMGYETLLCPGGLNFSGGQRQLIALTALMASERPLLLLDEAMANLDAFWKARLYGSRLFQDKTVLMASHEPAVHSLNGPPVDFRVVDLGAMEGAFLPETQGEPQ